MGAGSPREQSCRDEHAWSECPEDDDAVAWAALEAHEAGGPDPALFVDPYDEPPPRLGDPVSPRLLGHLSHRLVADVPMGELVAGLSAWQRFEGFTISRLWVEFAELHARFSDPARTRLEVAHASGDEDAALEAADEVDLATRSLVAEIATALSWSHSRASGQLEVALVLTSDLTATLDAVAAGLIDVRRAEVIARSLLREDSDLRRVVEAEILGGASGWNAPELRDRIRKSLLRAAPELAARRAESARKQRGVSFHAEPDDMVRMEALLPVEDGVRVQAALDVAALDQRQCERDGGQKDDATARTLDQIRADLLADAITALGTDLTAETPADLGPATPRRTRRGLRHEVVLTIPFETITGDTNEPGYLSRYGPISGPVAKKLALIVAQEGYWRCAVTDRVHGTLLGLGRSMFTPAYQAPEYLQRFVNLRHQVCDFPGCRVSAAACDFEHTIPHPQGATCDCGGAKRCRNHHRFKHRTGWRVRRSENSEHSPGSHIWMSPTGREYVTGPAVVGVPEPTVETAFDPADSEPPPY